MSVQVSVIIPTNRPLARLAPCLRGLAGQSVGPDAFEVIVVYNGAPVPPDLRADDWGLRLVVRHAGAANISAAKNVGVRAARGEWIALINDDVVPDADFLEAHLAAHAGLPEPGMVLGLSEWGRYDDERIFDRLIATTSMIFFYDRLAPHRWYNFRHAWNLNLSLRREHAVAVPFDERLAPVNFDDVEWAFRIERQRALRVWYAPEARQTHWHRYTLDSYLRRERHLGAMAVRLWHANPTCFTAIYRCTLPELVDYSRTYAEHEGAREDELYDAVRRAVGQPCGAWSAAVGVEGAALERDLLGALYVAHLPLKRLAFRRGLLAAASEPRCACVSRD